MVDGAEDGRDAGGRLEGPVVVEVVVAGSHGLVVLAAWLNLVQGDRPSSQVLNRIVSQIIKLQEFENSRTKIHNKTPQTDQDRSSIQKMFSLQKLSSTKKLGCFCIVAFFYAFPNGLAFKTLLVQMSGLQKFGFKLRCL